MITLFIAHAAADAVFAEQLGAFLEAGCDVSVFEMDGMMRPGEDLLDAAERGLAADILAVLISAASNPPRWVRERWEPVLFTRAAEAGTRVAYVMLEESAFPGLLRRGSSFCDGTASRVDAMRRLKRWIWGIILRTEPAMTFSADLETLYAEVADHARIATASCALARRFVREANRDFEAVFWVPAHGRTLAQIACELGSQMGLPLPGPVSEDCGAIRNLLSKRRCLVVLEAPQLPVGGLLPQGRTSVLFTTDAVSPACDPPSIGSARRLLAAGRVSEAYEVFNRLLEAGVEEEACARELIWICEQWDRMDEANRMRFLVNPAAGEQLSLQF